MTTNVAEPYDPMLSEATVAAPSRLTMSGISKHYAGVAALTNVSLDVGPGEVHALLGENGAGKSTLMNIASGSTGPDSGTIVFDGVVITDLSPALASELGIATVHQHPAVLPDLTVAENILVAVPSRFLRSHDDVESSMRTMLDDVGFTGHLEDRVGMLSVAQKHLLELAKALVVSPRLLILDEPTATLGQESVEMLFDRIRTVAATGAAVVYITHRLAEVRVIADRVTVLGDGRFRGVQPVEEVTDDELLALIVGRQLDSTFPHKHVHRDGDHSTLTIKNLDGPGFSGISLCADRGEIVGVAGIVGNGQSPLLRSLAGLESFSGEISIAGRSFHPRELREHSAYMPADRHAEGLMMTLSVRENAGISALERLKRGPLLSRSNEVAVVSRELSALDVRAPTLETTMAALSGGNQQKVVMARALLAEPVMLIADEPTQGVDVGARAEIYRILREVSEIGVPVVVASSDAKELEGLCDRVLVMSRGESVVELVGADVTEDAIIGAAMRADAHRRSLLDPADTLSGSTRRNRFLSGDYAPVAVVALVMLVLGAYVYSRNDRYLSAFNTTSVMFLCAALGFIAIGQTICLLLGGIDLSVGPLAGFLVVVGSFFMSDGEPAGMWVLGLLVMLGAAMATGLTNGVLIRFGKFTPVAATLATYIALQGLSFVLRDVPGGLISRSVTDAITFKVGRVPLAFVAFVVIAFAMEHALRRTRWGLRLRAVGSDEDSARKVGVKVTPTVLMGYVAVSSFVFIGAIILLAQLGIGDPAQGEGYTLSSITAVVLGGTSLLGGRGTFIGTLLGAGLSVQVLNATTFLGLSQTWVFFFQGALVVAAAIVYSQVRGRLATSP
jgi:ribose transport system ATP-binding protein